MEIQSGQSSQTVEMQSEQLAQTVEMQRERLAQLTRYKPPAQAVSARRPPAQKRSLRLH
jgi:hypothetical protein